jgi:adenylate cyclase
MRHRYAAIIAADVVRYSKFMEDDCEGTISALKDCRSVFLRCVTAHHGHEFGSVGDSLMAECPSPVEALRAALNIHSALGRMHDKQDDCDCLQLRIGLHAGDIVSDGKAMFGDVVNIAARLQEIAKPGGITMSAFFHEQVHNEPGVEFRSLGKQQIKNFLEPLQVYEVERHHQAINWRKMRLRFLPYKTSAAATFGVIMAGLLIIVYIESQQPGLGGIIEVPAAPAESQQLQADDKTSAITHIRSIVVLPFLNLMPDSAGELYSVRLAEEISVNLAHFPEFAVRSRTSALAYRDVRWDMRRIAAELRVDYVLEGSVRIDGNSVHVTAVLIDAKEDLRLWSDVFERELDNAFELQVEIAEAVARAVDVQRIDNTGESNP